MIRKKYIVILLLGLAAGLFSCTREDFSSGGGNGVIPDPDDFPQGYFTMSMDLSSLKSVQTKNTPAPGSFDDWGRDEENYVARVRMVLYGAKIIGTDYDGSPVYDTDQQVVRYAFDFNIESKIENVVVGYDPETDDDIYADRIAGYHQYFYDNGTKTYVPAGAAQWPADQGKPHLYKTMEDENYPDYMQGRWGFITWARRVMIDEYKMMLILNPTSSEYAGGVNEDPSMDLYKITAVGQPLGEVWKAASLLQSDLRDKSKYGVAENNYFLMTNFQELVPVTKNLLMPTEQLANDNPVPVNVSRAVSKVTVTRYRDPGTVNRRAFDNDNFSGETTQIFPAGASAKDFRFDLDATNQKTYWMRRMTNIIESYSGQKGIPEELSHYFGREEQYAEDPNYSTVTEKGANFNYLARPTPELNYYFSYEIPENDPTGEDFAYCLENTLDNESSSYPTRLIDRSDVLTTVWISCKYAPPGLTAGDSYYVWKNTSISFSMMAGFIEKPTTIPSHPSFSGLAEAIGEAKGADIDLAPGHSFNEHGIKYYHDGVNYYSTVIVHGINSLIRDEFTNETTGPGYGYYGAVRNVHYDIFIRAIHGQGMPTIEEIPDPSSENGNIEFEIRLNPWQERNQSSKPGNPVRPPEPPPN